jgi:predicted PurR-regulated permease PerM
MLEILPNIGPTISAVPAMLVAFFTISPAMSVAVLALYVLIQQLENNFIAPQVMRHSVGIHPVVSIILLLVGFRLGGVVGAALAIPLFIAIKVTFAEIPHLKKLRLKKHPKPSKS